MNKNIRALLAEPEPMTRRGILSEINQHNDIEIVALASTTADALGTLRQQSLDVAIVSIKMPDVSGLKVLTQKVPVILFTSEQDPDTILQAMVGGARGYLLKTDESINVAEAIRQVAGGNVMMCRKSLKIFLDAVQTRMSMGDQNPPPILTARELEILSLLAEGLERSEIAAMLTVSQSTVKNTCRSIYAKLRVKNKASAIRAGRRAGLIHDAQVL